MAEYACCSSVAFERPNENTFTFTFTHPVPLSTHVCGYCLHFSRVSCRSRRCVVNPPPHARPAARASPHPAIPSTTHLAVRAPPANQPYTAACASVGHSACFGPACLCACVLRACVPRGVPVCTRFHPGSWFVFFEIIGYAAVLSNLGVVIFTTEADFFGINTKCVLSCWFVFPRQRRLLLSHAWQLLCSEPGGGACL